MRLQVATNHTEDEPDTSTEGKVVALTVHKAKGLEFDRVVVPWTSTRFGTPRSVSTRAAVRDDEHGPPRLLWRWHLNKGTSYESDFTNLPPERQAEWRADDEDTLREETRLLYVAMTRARHELALLRGPGGRGSASRPGSWGDLLEGAV